LFRNFDLTSVLISYVVLLFSLCVHEASHAASAYWLGDDTAKRMGRLTLNPIAHIDPIGTVLFPLLGMSTGIPLIGWAKPVPFNPVNFTRKIRMRTGDMIVSAAGPASNLLLAILAMPTVAVLVRFLVSMPDQRVMVFRDALMGGYHNLITAGFGPGLALVLVLVGKLVWLNLALALFNLLPMGPLDGAWILRGFLPDRWVPTFDHYRPAMGILLLILVMLTDVLGYLLGPVLDFLFRLLLPVARLILAF